MPVKDGRKGFKMINGFREAGDRKIELLKKLNIVTQFVAKNGVDVKAFLNMRYPHISIKKIPAVLTTKQISGLISELYSL